MSIRADEIIESMFDGMEGETRIVSEDWVTLTVNNGEWVKSIINAKQYLRDWLSSYPNIGKEKNGVLYLNFHTLKVEQRKE